MNKIVNKIKWLNKKLIDTNLKVSKIESSQEELFGLIRENYWANVFNTATQGSEWFHGIPLNVGRWAVNYTFLYLLYRILNELQPNNIVEMGMGESTKMLQKYKENLNKDALCLSVEHDKKWIEAKINNGISKEFITIINAETEYAIIEGKKTLQYKSLSEHLATFGERFNLFVIDGPYGSPNYSRYNIIELFKNHLFAEDFIVMMDDYNRLGEQETIFILKELLKKEGINFYEGLYKSDKSILFLSSEKYRWATSF